jgi:hypothetical protein
MNHEDPHNTDTAGYVEVNNEPLHKEVYADRYFRAYIATLTPGQATDYHRHSEDTVYLVINGGRVGNKNFKGYNRSPMAFPQSFPFHKKLWFALQNVFTCSIYLPDGLFFFMPTKKYPSIHQAAASPRNPDEVSLMGVEMRYGSANPIPLVHNTLPGRVEYDNGVLSVLVCTLASATSSRIVMPGYQLFMVCTKGLFEIMLEHAPHGKSNLCRLDTGDYLCISGDSPALARNAGNAAAEMIILAIPVDN